MVGCRGLSMLDGLLLAFGSGRCVGVSLPVVLSAPFNLHNVSEVAAAAAAAGVAHGANAVACGAIGVVAGAKMVAADGSITGAAVNAAPGGASQRPLLQPVLLLARRWLLRMGLRLA